MTNKRELFSLHYHHTFQLVCDHKQQLLRQRATILFGDGILPIPGSTVRALTWTFIRTCAIPMHENLDLQIQMCTHNILIRCNAKFDTLRSIIAPCDSFFYRLVRIHSGLQQITSVGDGTGEWDQKLIRFPLGTFLPSGIFFILFVRPETIFSATNACQYCTQLKDEQKQIEGWVQFEANIFHISGSDTQHTT